MTNLTIRIDEKLKADAEALFASLGLDLNQAITIFLRQSILERGLPFRPHLVSFHADFIGQDVKENHHKQE